MSIMSMMSFVCSTIEASHFLPLSSTSLSASAEADGICGEEPDDEEAQTSPASTASTAYSAYSLMQGGCRLAMRSRA